MRTASLMTDPEYFFDEQEPGRLPLFAVHYLILPSRRPPPVAAELMTVDGPYALWRTGSSGYLRVGTVVGTLDADRTDLGTRSFALLRSPLGSEHAYLRVNFGATRRNPVSLPAASQAPATGSVATEHDHLEQGTVTATVRMRTAGVVVLSASFDPGWTATVDGQRRRTVMIAPALVGVRVPAGVHRLALRYVGFSGYPSLFVISVLALAVLFLADRVLRRRRRAAAEAPEPPRPPGSLAT